MRWKWIRWVLGILAVLIIALIITVYAVLSNYDFNSLKPRIARAVKDATGRELSLVGDIDLDIGFSPALVVEDVRFRNAPWGSRPELAQVRRFEVQVALLPLITGNIEVKRLTLIEPDILIETDKSGKSNLEFETSKKIPAAKPKEDAPAKEMKLPALTFTEVRIEKVRFTYKDGPSGETYSVNLDSLTTGAADIDTPLSLVLKGAYNHNPFEVKGTLGPIAALTDTERPWTVKLTAKAGGAAVTLDGSIMDPMNGKGISLAVTLEGRSVSDIAKLANASGVPDIGPFTAGFKISDPAVKTYKLSDLRITLGDNKLDGSMEISLAGKRPLLTAVLSSRKLDLRQFLSKDEGKSDRKRGSGEAAAKKEKLFPEDPLPIDALNQADADVRFKAGEIMLPQLALNDLNVHVLIEKGHLVKTLKAVIGGGTLDARFDLLPQGKTAAMTTAMKITGLDLGRMLKELDVRDMIEGKLDMDLNVSGRGGSIAGIMAGLNGKTILIMDKGRINNKYIDMLGADLSSGLFRVLNPKKEKAEYSEFNCFVSGFGIKNGLADVTALIFDTNAMSVVGNGRINLKTEELDLGLRPSPKKGIDTGVMGKLSLSLGELARPLKLAGTLADPSLTVDPTQTAITLGKAVGGVVLFGPVGIAAALASESPDDENPCLTAIEAAKKGIRVSGDKKPEKEKGVVEGIGDKLKGLFGK
ncbi:MAG: AsmA family protein [Deltaproteobacteria bacterium]|nr:AsmA family protein [Deltaproteobacteria bacterium]MBW2343924.1 AsmA family protein [Deltaproteobacteria bacterium]